MADSFRHSVSECQALICLKYKTLPMLVAWTQRSLTFGAIWPPTHRMSIVFVRKPAVIVKKFFFSEMYRVQDSRMCVEGCKILYKSVLQTSSIWYPTSPLNSFNACHHFPITSGLFLNYVVQPDHRLQAHQGIFDALTCVLCRGLTSHSSGCHLPYLPFMSAYAEELD